MIEETDFGYAVACDFCSNEIEVQASTFEFAVKCARHRGWGFTRNEQGHWLHTCPACLEEREGNRTHANSEPPTQIPATF